MKTTRKLPKGRGGQARSGEIAPGDVSVLTTLIRTVTLVILTLLIAASVRFLPPATHFVQRIAGTETWQSLYGVFGVGGATEREQMILVGIVIGSFVLALLVQSLALLIWHRLLLPRRRRA